MIRRGKTSNRSIENAFKIMDQNKLLGVVFNDVKPMLFNTYFNRGYYHYGVDSRYLYSGNRKAAYQSKELSGILNAVTFEKGARHPMKILKVRPRTRHTADGIADEVIFNRIAFHGTQAIRTYGRTISSRAHQFRTAGSAASQSAPSKTLELPIAASIRDTDVTGWHRNRSTIGVIFTALKGTSRAATRTAVSGKIQKLLAENLQRHRDSEKWRSRFTSFPKAMSRVGNVLNPGRSFMQNTRDEDFQRRLFAAVKRTIDIAGSLFGVAASIAAVRGHFHCDQNDIGWTDFLPAAASWKVTEWNLRS